MCLNARSEQSQSTFDSQHLRYAVRKWRRQSLPLYPLYEKHQEISTQRVEEYEEELAVSLWSVALSGLAILGLRQSREAMIYLMRFCHMVCEK
jgi:hypothetical protein